MAFSKLSSHRAVMSYNPDLSQSRTDITLFLQGSKTPLNLRLSNATTLGRLHKASPKKPDVDLTPYNAYEKGVSRLHLVVQWRDDGQLTVADLGSANGTWLNRRRLVPNKAEIVHDGDEIRLGQLILYVCLKKTANMSDCHPNTILSVDSSNNDQEKTLGNRDTKRLPTEVLRRYWVPESSGKMNLNFPDEGEDERWLSDDSGGVF